MHLKFGDILIFWFQIFYGLTRNIYIIMVTRCNAPLFLLSPTCWLLVDDLLLVFIWLYVEYMALFFFFHSHCVDIWSLILNNNVSLVHTNLQLTPVNYGKTTYSMKINQNGKNLERKRPGKHFEKKPKNTQYLVRYRFSLIIAFILLFSCFRLFHEIHNK